MPDPPFTIIDGDIETRVSARVDGERVWLSPDAVTRALGWEVTEDGLCRDGLCVPVPADAALATGDGIDLVTLAATLDRPLACDVEERAACLGAPAPDRGRALASLQAPDFALPDLGGGVHRLSDHRGRKVLLVVWASW